MGRQGPFLQDDRAGPENLLLCHSEQVERLTPWPIDTHRTIAELLSLSQIAFQLYKMAPEIHSFDSDLSNRMQSKLRSRTPHRLVSPTETALWKQAVQLLSFSLDCMLTVMFHLSLCSSHRQLKRRHVGVGALHLRQVWMRRRHPKLWLQVHLSHLSDRCV